MLIFISMAVAYRRWEPLLIHTLSLIFAIAACVALLKLTNTRINMLNALAFPLILGVGVDYGMHVLLAMLEGKELTIGLTTVVKPLVISGLTTIAGFGALIFAQNPALKGLGNRLHGWSHVLPGHVDLLCGADVAIAVAARLTDGTLLPPP